jgi:hypothetical protein
MVLISQPCAIAQQSLVVRQRPLCHEEEEEEEDNETEDNWRNWNPFKFVSHLAAEKRSRDLCVLCRKSSDPNAEAFYVLLFVMDAYGKWYLAARGWDPKIARWSDQNIANCDAKRCVKCFPNKSALYVHGILAFGLSRLGEGEGSVLMKPTSKCPYRAFGRHWRLQWIWRLSVSQIRIVSQCVTFISFPNWPNF